MKVKIKEDDNQFELRKDDVYEAEMYDDSKVSLIKRDPDGFDPQCNAYIHDVLFLVGGEWVERDCGCCVDYGDEDYE